MTGGFFALLDDVASLMDDVATMSKVAGKETAGILGDDLAVNAEKASGFLASRELPVLWAISKGSVLNKLIILPFAFLLSAFVPLAITVILIIGGFYLAYEGAHKVYEWLVPHHNQKTKATIESTPSKSEEKAKIKSAILTDFILSVEIIIIALGTVPDVPLQIQIPVVTIIALAATVGVYGIVALIVRMDDLGLKLIQLNPETNTVSDKIGRVLVQALPKVVKALTIIGTIALFLVSGGIFVHNLPFMHHLEELLPLPSFVFEFITGIIAGFVVVSIIKFSLSSRKAKLL